MTLPTSEHKAIERYILRYAEPEVSIVTEYSDATRQTDTQRNKQYQHCLVIPAYNESDAFIQRLVSSPPQLESLLVIVVINQPDNDHNIHTNQALWDKLTQGKHISNLRLHDQNLRHSWLNTSHSSIDLLLIDRFTCKIPYKQGVGLARKIGGDIACKLYLEQIVDSYWVHHSDADTHLPHDYFTSLKQEEIPNASAAVYQYQHIDTGDKQLHQATHYYEQALDYYVSGLRRAGSPYAYHTLGSCIASHIVHYSQAHGFPKKPGGEDFYLLNKLAKLGKVLQLQNSPLLIESRLSDRVPFGTGPAVKKIAALSESKDHYLYYHPDCFTTLKVLLEHFSCLFDYHKQGKLEQWLLELNESLQHSLKLLNIDILFKHIEKQIQNREQCLLHCHHWLDGFKTLKLIHLLEREFPEQYAKQPLVQSLSTLDSQN